MVGVCFVLLCEMVYMVSLAQDAPHLIVYPAVVGASANEKLDNEAKGDGRLFHTQQKTIYVKAL